MRGIRSATAMCGPSSGRGLPAASLLRRKLWGSRCRFFFSKLTLCLGDVRQASVVQRDQAYHVILEMLKLVPILERGLEDIGMSSHERSGGHDRKLPQAIPFSVADGIGPESITLKSALAKHNRRDKDFSACLKSA